jgi:hypothetical protein
MKHLFLSASIIVLSGLLSACVTSPKPGSPEAAIKIAQEVKEEKEEAVEQIVSDIPDWCLNIPSSNSALYACGSGNSSNLNMSRTRANLDAKRQLADMIDSEISSRMEDFLSSVGTGSNEQIKQQSEIITKNVTIEAKLAGYKQVQAEAQNIGSKYQIYVLLEYPIGQANQALVNQIKQNQALSTQEAADEALAELEAEINKKKGS